MNKELETKSLSVLQKIQKCRVELQKKDIKKTGRNNNSKFNYFELGDFLPYINELCEKYQLSNIVKYQKDKAVLTITNMENEDQSILFDTDFKVSPLENCSDMQAIGAAQTYARKYLYQTAFEIAEHDSLDGGETPVDEQKEFMQKPIDATKVDTVKSMLKRTKINEKQFLKQFKLNKVEEMPNSLFTTVMDALEKKEIQEEKKKASVPDLGI